MVERRPEKAGVASSILAPGTINCDLFLRCVVPVIDLGFTPKVAGRPADAECGRGLLLRVKAEAKERATQWGCGEGGSAKA